MNVCLFTLGLHCTEANDLEVQQGWQAHHLRDPDARVHG